MPFTRTNPEKTTLCQATDTQRLLTESLPQLISTHCVPCSRECQSCFPCQLGPPFATKMAGFIHGKKLIPEMQQQPKKNLIAHTCLGRMIITLHLWISEGSGQDPGIFLLRIKKKLRNETARHWETKQTPADTTSILAVLQVQGGSRRMNKNPPGFSHSRDVSDYPVGKTEEESQDNINNRSRDPRQRQKHDSSSNPQVPSSQPPTSPPSCPLTSGSREPQRRDYTHPQVVHSSRYASRKPKTKEKEKKPGSTQPPPRHNTLSPLFHSVSRLSELVLFAARTVECI
jgi:hypothetical protein